MKELNIAVIGGVDCGKSSLLSVLKNYELDDGKGLARSKIVKFKHELESGRTSAVNQHFLQIDEDKLVCFVDLCGHEQYLKTTLHGMCGYNIDYAIIVIGGNLSITDMTREHLNTCLSLNIPFIVVITKIDNAPEHILERTKEVLRELLIQKVKFRNILWMENETQEQIIQGQLQINNLMKNVPIFMVSNKTGQNIDFLRQFIFQLPIRNTWVEEDNEHNLDNRNVLFSIDNFFLVKGIGNVVSGRLFKGNIKKNDKLFLGPFNGQFYQVSVRSFHDNFRNLIEKMDCGMSGCILIKSTNKQIDFKHFKHRKGVYLMSEEEMRNSIYSDFEAEVIVMGKHSTQISRNYTPVINCKKIVQSARIIEIKNKDYIRPGERSMIHFQFIHRPEFLQVGDRCIFREGTTRGVGIIRALIRPNLVEVPSHA